MSVERRVLFWLLALLSVVLALLLLKDVLLPFLVGMVIAYALNPIAERMVRFGIGRTWASALVVAALLVVFGLAMVLLVPLLANQVQQLIASAPAEFERIKAGLEGFARARLGAYFPDVKANIDSAISSSNWSNIAAGVAKSVWAQGLALVNFMSLLLITPLVVFYLLVDWHPMLEKLNGWLPRDHQTTIRRISTDINEAIAAFIRGQGLVCVALGGIYAVGLSAIGLKYGLLIGIGTGIASFVPFVGWALGLIVAVVLAALQFGPEPMVFAKVAAVFMAGMAIDTAVLSPKFVGEKIGLHPVWLMVALFVFSYLFGTVGVLVAVPVAAAVGVLVRFGLEVYLDSSIYKGNGEASDMPPTGAAPPTVVRPAPASAPLATTAPPAKAAARRV
jgi:predicted PurR-regulated permease PerM